MHSQLSSTTLSQLTPLLGSLARHIARGTALSDQHLHMLLIGAALETDLAALAELQRWVRLLSTLQAQSDPTSRQVIVEALMLRGLPEATVLLAVAAVADTPASVLQPRLLVTPERLDFGTLSAAAPITATFEITGGAGHIVVESDYVRVTPTQFGPGATRVQVEVLPFAGGLLWTTLKLVTASASLEVPVTAQWDAASPPQTGAAVAATPAPLPRKRKPQAVAPAPPQAAAPNVSAPQTGAAVAATPAPSPRKRKAQAAASPQPATPNDGTPPIDAAVVATPAPPVRRQKAHAAPPPQPVIPPPPQPPLPPQQPSAARAQPGAPIVVTPATTAAESGRQLLQALASAPAGATITLQAGTYEVAQPLVIDKPLTLKGAGKDQTRLRCAAPGYVSRFVGAGPFVVADISFEHTGTVWAHVVEVASDAITMQGCRFTGGILDQAGGRGGSGLCLLVQTRGTVAQCEMVGNGAHGIVVGGQAQPTLEMNTCQKNAFSGIAYCGSAAGIARQNSCTDNAQHGICVDAQAQPLLDTNTCQQNNLCGITYKGYATGVARQNTCVFNAQDGIAIGEQAQPTLEVNTCRHNKRIGIFYCNNAGGSARRNLCSCNGTSGIYVGGATQPTLDLNICFQNEGTGIAYYNNASGIAKNNSCMNNNHQGIFVGDHAQPTLTTNQCKDNLFYGISVAATANPTLSANRCTGNRERQVNDQRKKRRNVRS